MGKDAHGDRGRPGWAGAHLVTLVSREREPLFGRVIEGCMASEEPGRIVAEEWQRIPGLAPGARLDAFVVMPNHIHGIIRLGGPTGGKARGRSGHPARRGRPSEAAALGAIVSQFKAAATRRVNALRGSGGPLWQQGYRDLSIESEQELAAVRRLICENPERWEEDVENPQRAGQPTPPAE